MVPFVAGTNESIESEGIPQQRCFLRDPPTQGFEVPRMLRFFNVRNNQWKHLETTNFGPSQPQHLMRHSSDLCICVLEDVKVCEF